MSRVKTKLCNKMSSVVNSDCFLRKLCPLKSVNVLEINLLSFLPGATKDIGSALTRMCMRHRSIESKLKLFTM